MSARSRFFLGVFAFAMVLAVFASPAPAQTPGVANPNPKSQLRQTLNRPQFAFNHDDYLRARLGRIKSTFFVGEPVVIPIILSNHTNYPITITTNFIPRSHLQVVIRQPGKPSRAYHGPFEAGTYTPVDIFLYPLEEYTHPFVIWSDQEQPGNLAFSEPGEYAVELNLKYAIIEGGQPGRLPLGSVTIQVVPAPAQLQPAVEAIRTNGAVFYLHQRKLPPQWEPKAIELLNLPPNPLMPYFAIAYADFLQQSWNILKKDPAKAEQAENVAQSALYLYQQAALSDSAYKLEAHDAWLRYLDLLGRAKEATQVAAAILEIVPEDRLGKMGDRKLIKKYLINTDELEPSRYWTIMQ